VTHLTDYELERMSLGTLLRVAYRAALDKANGVEPEVTGRRWTRPKRVCPDFCARDHTCTAQHGYPSGEHRSPNRTDRADWGAATYTRVEHIDGTASLEIRLRVKLSPVRALATIQALFYRTVLGHAVNPAALVAAEQARLASAGATLGAAPARPALPARRSA
jgi:hypothetical protein